MRGIERTGGKGWLPYIPAILLGAVCVALGLLLFRGWQGDWEEARASGQRLVSAHGTLAKALAEEPLTLENQQLAVVSVAAIRREVLFLSQRAGGDEAQWKGLRRFYESAENFLAGDLVRGYPTAPRGEGTVLTGVDRSKARFLRKGCERVAGMEGENWGEALFQVWGDVFEGEFHTFSRYGFFKAEDPLREYWGT